MRILSSVARVSLVLALTAGPALAQGDQTGRISGIVRSSPDNLPFPGASITISSPAKQGDETATTDETGTFVFRGLAPGTYTVAVEVAGMAPGQQTVDVLLGRESRIELNIVPAGVKETVTVTAKAPPPLAETRNGFNFRFDEVNALANTRTLSAVTQLAPGVTDTAPNAAEGQVVISGGFAYDNIFLVDGIDVDDNLFGTPAAFGTGNGLFIEDAIEETQVLSSGISAEYGRFSGGVVNAITRRGGNDFSGSFRINFSNAAWSTETPFEEENGVERESNVNPTYEITFGGPVARDRLWFFFAGRYADTASTATLPQTGIPFENVNDNKRFEFKLTGAPIPNHTLQTSYVRNNTTLVRVPFAGPFPASIDPLTIDEERRPSNQFAASYRGVLTKSIFGELQYSQKKFAIEDRGGTSANLADSPFIDFFVTGAHYNAPYFDASDPEERNNRQFTGSASYFLSTSSFGRHDIKTGFEHFTSTWKGGNSQSSTGNVYYSGYKADAAGNPVFDASGHLIPQFIPFNTSGPFSLIDIFEPDRGAKMDIRTLSLYLQDRWAPNAHWAFNLGTRFEHVRSEASGGIEGAKADTIVPRLALTFDPKGDGKYIFQSTYGHYAGKYSERQFGANTNVGHPNELFGIYLGPPGEGRNFAPGLDPTNYFLFFADFPRQNVTLADDLSSPVTREFTASAGAQLGGSGYGKVTYAHRRTYNIVEDFITLATGSTVIVADGMEIGEFPNLLYENTDIAKREYDALQFQGRYQIRGNWSLNGHWTVQLKNDGNFEGEAGNRPAITSVIGNYPEIFTAARHYPTGHLDDFQRSRLRIWSVYNWDLARLGDLDISGLVRVDSATTYSLIAGGQPLSAIQAGMITGYAQPPDAQDIFFRERGSEFFEGYGLFDASVHWAVPVLGTVRPWVKFDIFNVFNNQKLIRWNTVIRPDPASPTDALGLPTGFIEGAQFGKAQSNNSFPIPFVGATGGRTFLMSAGVRLP